MAIVRSYIVEVPVTIEAADEPSLTAAKKHLRSFFHRVESGANHENLFFKVAVDNPKLIPRDIDDE